MPTIKIPTPLRPYTEGKRELALQGNTVGMVVHRGRVRWLGVFTCLRSIAEQAYLELLEVDHHAQGHILASVCQTGIFPSRHKFILTF